jgi:streptomycin 6-kinase
MENFMITKEKLSEGHGKLTRAKERWGLTEDGDYFASGNSLLQPVISEGRLAMLKVPLSGTAYGGFRLLACWNGKGAAKVYHYDANALLMERAIGERSLRQMVFDGQEDEANTILCRLAEQLHSIPCRQIPELVTLPIWFKSLGEAAGKNGGFFTTCHEMADALLRDPLDEVALHGDIHYDNVLDAGSRGWIAIDPKGLVGERGFDFANIFCNPDLTIAGSPERLSKQAKLIAGLTGLPAERLLCWVIAWSGLMASWMLEDGEEAELPMRVGELAIKELTTC